MDTESLVCVAVLSALAQAVARLNRFARTLRDHKAVVDYTCADGIPTHLDGWHWEAWVGASFADGTAVDWGLDIHMAGDAFAVQACVGEVDGFYVELAERKSSSWKGMLAGLEAAIDELLATMTSIPELDRKFRRVGG